MKNFLAILAISFLSIQLFASELVLIPTHSWEESQSHFKNPALRIHFYRDEFVIASAQAAPKTDYFVLDKNGFNLNLSYYLVYTENETMRDVYTKQIQWQAEVLFTGDTYLVVRSDERKHGQLPPAKNDGMVKIFDRTVTLPAALQLSTAKSFDPDPFVLDLLEQVEATNITSQVQHMENYGTRNAYAPASVQAQQWIAEQFLEWGLEVEVMDFSMPGGAASDNVIATLVGTKYPNEYVVLGGHYDSYSNAGLAPGADDNASGTSGVMEIARILSQYEFDRTIVFCAFSGEEYGLYGSAAYASRSAAQGMDIHGYFNMDMIGYLKPTNFQIKTTLIYPQSASALAEFYTTVAAVYLPNFIIETGALMGGDSDHTSFNNNGYMGIFPFEDANNYSPYIHTSNDIVGPSYNNAAQAVVFTKATLASVVTMANMLTPPRNLVAIPGDEKVNLQWDPLVDASFFKIYRNGLFLSESTENTFIDHSVENGTLYEYYVTAIYADSGEESDPSNRAYATPMPPIAFPLFIDFENGTPYWDLDQKWGLTSTQYFSPTHALTESPLGNYENARDDFATLGPLNLLGYTAATLSFQTRYDLENDYDYMYLKVSTDGINWTTLDTYTGTQNTWMQKSYNLNSYLNQPYLLIRFHFTSDYSVTREGMYIDDFSITVEGGYDVHAINIPAGWSGISSHILPWQGQMADIFQPVFEELVIVQNMTDTYWPEENINTLGTWAPQSAYKIKVNHDVTLHIAGTFDENNLLNISAGWNLIPVISNCPANLEELFAGEMEHIVLLKEIAGTGILWPSQDINTLGELTPGSAYLLKAESDFSISFTWCDAAQHTQQQNKEATAPWQIVARTGNSHAIAIPAQVLQNFNSEDYIGVFTSDGLCAGYTQINDPAQNHYIIAFANDSINSSTDGFLQDEPLLFRLFTAQTQEYFALIATFDEEFPQTNHFQAEGISALASLVVDDTGIVPIQMVTDIYPNPAHNQITINIRDSRQALLKITSLTGQVMKMIPVRGHEVIDISTLPKGMYIFQLEGKDFSDKHKVVVR